MISVYKRELKSYFGGLFGWCLLAAMILTGALVVVFDNFLSLSTDLASALSTLSLFLILFVPILTARAFTQDRTLGALPWLQGLPVRTWEIAVGKYLAALTLILFSALPLATLPPILANFGTVSHGASYVALLGYFLLAAALTAICAFVAQKLKNRLLSFLINLILSAALFFLPLLATVCEVRPWLGWIICAGICLLIGIAVALLRRNWLTGALSFTAPTAILALLLLIPKFYTHVFSKILFALSPFDRFNGFLSGHFDLPATLLLVSLAIFFVLLTVHAQGKRKPTFKRALTDRRTVIALGTALLLILCNLSAHLLPFRASYPDVSNSTTYLLSDTTVRYLSTLEEDVEIVYYSYGGKESADRDLYSFVLQYADASARIHVRLENTEDTAKDQTVKISSAKREKTLSVADLFYYYNSSTQMLHSLLEYAQILQYITNLEGSADYDTWKEAYAPGTTVAYFAGDANLTGAIRYAVADHAPTVYAYGKGTPETINFFLRQKLEQSAYDVRTLSTCSAIPSDCHALLLSLAQDISDEEAAAISEYLARGGTVLLYTDYASTNLPTLYSLLSAYGMTAPTKTNLLYDASSASQMFYGVEGALHPVTDLFSGSFVAAYAHKIDLWEVEGVSQTVLLQSPETSVCITQNEDSPAQGSFPICVLAQKDASRVVWLSMLPDSYSHGLSGGANANFTSCVLQWATDTAPQALNISDTTLVSEHLEMKQSAFVLLTSIFAAALPILCLAFGGIRYYVRRRR